MSVARGQALAEEELRAVAGDRSFERGLGYVRAVTGLERAGDQVLATVRGAQDYLVVLTLPDGRVATGLRGECGCPYGQEGFFCKHCVAVGLAVARGAVAVPGPRAGGGRTSRSAPGPGGRGADLSSWLARQSREELLTLIGHQLLEDEEWRHRLGLRAAAAAADLPAVSERVATLLTPAEEPAVGREYYGYLEGAQARRYGCRIAEISEVVTGLAGRGQADAAAIVAEEALGAVAAAARHANDPAGSIAAAAGELTRRHLDACRAGQPDQVRLAAFLATRLVSGDSIPAIRLSDYAGVLSPAGLELLGELVTAAWERQPAGGPARDALIDVLTAARDVDGIVRVLAAGQDPCGHHYLRITAELDMAGRPGDALAWAERGLREASRPDADLARYVAERYREHGRDSEIETVLRSWFATDRSVAGYRRLRELAEDAGCWATVRPWALGRLREDAKLASAQGRARREPAIVDALIGDGDIDAAWPEATGLASQRQWLALADLAASERPADALAVYRRQIEELRKSPGPAGYERLARLLESARDCCERLGNLAEFETYVRALRDDHRRKPRLIRVLDAHQLGSHA
ncbi:MAG: SWIM zinc finger family protein [Streptosporangiaceae bacterium]